MKLYVKIRSWLLPKIVKYQLLKRRRWDYELELLNEKWLIKRIQDGQLGRRSELSECQKRIKEIDLFINFINSK